MDEIKNKFSGIFSLLVLVGIILFLGYTLTQAKVDAINLIFFDVGQGDAALFVTPKGQDVLIDGGPDDTVLTKLDENIPFYSHQLDAIIVTHPHADHVSGLVAVANKYQIGRVYMSGVVHTAPEYLAFLEILKQNKVPVQLVKVGDSLQFGDGINLQFLYPLKSMESKSVDNLNNSSIVTRLTWGESRVIMMGDLESEAQEDLVKGGQELGADIIKISHHGSSDSINYRLLSSVGPKYAVISVGQDNKFGHPSQKVLELLSNIVTLRTDYHGDIRFQLTPTSVIANM